MYLKDVPGNKKKLKNQLNTLVLQWVDHKLIIHHIYRHDPKHILLQKNLISAQYLHFSYKNEVKINILKIMNGC